MKLLKLVLKNKKHISYKNIYKSIAGVSLAMLLSCTTEVPVHFTDTRNMPLMSGKNVDMHYTDSAKLEMRVLAPVVNDFSNQEDERKEFPKGITVIQYNDKQEESSRITAKYAIHWPKDYKWEAKRDVVVTSEDGRILNTEYLVWDMKEHIFYTNQRVRIQDGENITYGKGFQADEKMKNWEIIDPSGEITEDEE